MSQSKPYVHPAIQAILEGSGAQWSAVRKSRHVLLIINGRAAAVLPGDRANQERDRGRGWKNTLACVRRACRAAQG